MKVFDFEAIDKIQNQADLRWYKRHNLFNHQAFSTCPVNPKFHAAHGEPLVHMPVAQEHFSASINENAVKLMARIDTIELDEQAQEVFVKDDFGIYILHDCVLEDLKSLEAELIKIGSFFIQKSECLISPE